MTFEEFKTNVQQWAQERGIYEHSTPEAQLLKALSELGELADAVIKDDIDGIKDAVGDVAVCMVNYARMAGVTIRKVWYEESEHCESSTHIGIFASHEVGRRLGAFIDGGENVDLDDLLYIAMNYGLDFMDCCEHAWNEIKDRKGRMVPGGAFVKDD